MGIRTGLILALFLASGCASPLMLEDDDALVVIPHEVGSAGHIIVQVMVNDHGPFRFALDTGASISVVFDKTREEAGLELLAGEHVLVHGMIGSGSFPLTTIAELKVGSESWSDARVASLPANEQISAEIDGILGVDFLQRYAVGVSTSDQVVRLYPPLLVRERSYGRWHSIPLRKLKIGRGTATVYTITLRIGSIGIPAMLDLGAGFNLMNWRAARAIRIEPKGAMSEKVIRGVVEDASVVAELKVRSLRVQNLYWGPKRFFVSKFAIFEVLDLENQPAAIVGPNFLERRDFIIDFARNRVLVSESR